MLRGLDHPLHVTSGEELVSLALCVVVFRCLLVDGFDVDSLDVGYWVLAIVGPIFCLWGSV